MGSGWELGTAETASEYPGPLSASCPQSVLQRLFAPTGQCMASSPSFFSSLIASCLATCIVLAAK